LLLLLMFTGGIVDNNVTVIPKVAFCLMIQPPPKEAAARTSRRQHHVECMRELLVVEKSRTSDANNSTSSRREFVQKAAMMVGGSSSALLMTRTLESASAAGTGGSLAARLSQRDAAALSNSVFNIPPPAQVYPPFMRGTWNVTLTYSGYLFPSTKIQKSKLTTNPQIPGFQKCSIAMLSDVGKVRVSYILSIDETTGLEDRKKSLSTSIDDHLGYPAVQEVLYNPKANPNRLSIIFFEYRTTNAERIELFCNGRESELIEQPQQQTTYVVDDGQQQQHVPPRKVFVCSEFIRQVTFGTGSQVGIPRQVGTNYAHFWTWKEDPTSNSTQLTGNVLTAAYLDPQDAMFFDEPSKPVAVYSHIVTAKRVQ
jgi:hypothetical protein